MDRIIADLRNHPLTLVFAVLAYGALALALHVELERAKPTPSELEMWLGEAGFLGITHAAWEAEAQALLAEMSL